jgi:hypothetical protein
LIRIRIARALRRPLLLRILRKGRLAARDGLSYAASGWEGRGAHWLEDLQGPK